MINDEEARQLIMTMVVVYPNMQVNDATIMPLIRLYERVFKNYTYDELSQALEVYVSSNTSGFAPTPAHLIDIIETAYESEGTIDESEVWSMIYTAICRSSVCAKDDYENFPPIVKKVVGSASQLREWGQTATETVDDKIRNSVLWTYRNVVAEEKRKNRMADNPLSKIEKNESSLLKIGGADDGTDKYIDSKH